MRTIVLFTLILGLTVCIPNIVEAQTQWYWTNGGGDNSWANSDNWDDGFGGTGLPSAGDDVIFDGDVATGDCSLDVSTFNSSSSRINSMLLYNGFSYTVSIDQNFYLISLQISSGTLAQGTGSFGSIYVGDQTLVDGSFIMDGGTFTGSTKPVYINGTFSMTGGTFNASTNTTRVIRDFSCTGGTFDAKTGTFLFTHFNESVLTLNITGNVTFYRLTLSAANVLNNTSNYTFVIANTINVDNSFTIATGLAAGTRSVSINTGTINVKSTITLSHTSTSTNGGGSGTLNFCGTADQTLTGPTTDGQKRLCGIKVDKSSGTMNFANYITVCGNWEHTQGTLNFGTSTVTFAGTSAQTIKGASNSAFYNLTKNTTQSLIIGDPSTAGNTIEATNNFTWTDNNDNITVGNGQNVTFKVPGAITINNGQTLTSTSNGTIDFNGTWTNDGTFTHGNGTVIMRGTTASITGSATLNNFYNLTLNHASSGTVTIPSQKAVTVDGTLTLTNSNSTLLIDGSASGSSVYSGSLITNGTLTNNGNCNFKTGILKNQWHNISSPISSANIGVIFSDISSHNNNFYYYDETVSTNYWVQQTSGTMSVAKGYNVYYFNNKFKTYSGTYNTGNQNPSITYTSAGRKGWNLVGNPYPSAIDWKASSGWTKTNLNDAIYIKNGTVWATYINGVGANGGTRYIQPGQGFFIIANTTSPVLSMTNAVRVHNTSSSLLKEATQDFITRITINSDSMQSDAVVRFNHYATENFDPNFDAYKIFSDNINVPEVYTMSNLDSLSINSFSSFNQDVVIPLGIKTGPVGNYTIITNEIENLPANSQVILEDVLLDSLIVMTTTNSYSFTTNQSNINSTDRFNLKFNIVNPPVIAVQPASQTVCSESNVTLSVDVENTANATYQWYNSEGIIDGATQNSISFSSVSIADQDSYYCIITNNDGTTQSETATLTVNNLVSISSQPVGSILCENENYSLSVSAEGTGISYQWYKDNTAITGENSPSLSLSDITTSQDGTYHCEISGTCNILNSDFAIIEVKPLPVVELGQNITVCENIPVTLDAENTGATYIWNTNETSQIITPVESGTYAVSVTKDGCTTNDQIDITINSLPIVDLGNDLSLCETSSVALHAGNPGSAYNWNTGSTNSIVTITETGTYSLTVTDINGCIASDEVAVNFKPMPVVNLGYDQTICSGTTLTLDAENQGASYLWSDNSSNQTLEVSNSGTYTVTVTLDGCSAVDNINISTKPTPYIDLGSDFETCEGTYVSLDAGFVNGNTYLWNTGSQNQIIHPTSTGMYSVTVTRDGCSADATVGIVFNAIPAVNLGQDQNICDNQELILNANISNADYFWSTSETSQTIEPLYSGNYSVTVTQNGCSGYDAVFVQIKPSPYVNLGNDFETCAYSPILLDAGFVYGNTYNWNNGSHNQTLSISESGNYIVTVTNNGCSSTDEINIVLNPVPIVELGSDIEICSTCSATLDAGNSGTTYSWSNGATSQIITVEQPGTYTVTVTSTDGCSNSGSISVSISTGISTITDESGIQLFPNPVHSDLNIISNSKGMYEIKLTDLQGKVILSINTDMNHYILDMNTYENGVYLLYVISDNKTNINKIIKH